MDLGLVHFEEVAQGLKAFFLFVEFLAEVLVGGELGEDSKEIEDEVIGGGELLHQAYPGSKAIAVLVAEEGVGFLLSNQVSISRCYLN